MINRGQSKLIGQRRLSDPFYLLSNPRRLQIPKQLTPTLFLPQPHLQQIKIPPLLTFATTFVYSLTETTMEPISIASTSLGIIALCTKLIDTVSSFVAKTKAVDSHIRVLGLEVESLLRVVAAIHESFNNESVAAVLLASQTGHEAQHWKNVQRSLVDCQRTLETLEIILQTITGSRNRFLRRSRKLVNFTLQSEEIRLLKQQILSYTQTMQLSFQLITMYLHP